MKYLRRFKKVVFVVVLVTLVYIAKRGLQHDIVGPYRGNDRNHTPNMIDLKREAVEHGPQTLCLHVDPVVRNNELSPVKDYERLKCVCPGVYDAKSAWHVNFNVERLYRFRPYQVSEKSKPVPSAFDRVFNGAFDTPKDTKRSPTIPKIIHFIWTDEIIPTAFVDNLKLFRATHPTWKIEFWTLKAGRSFITQHEPKLTAIYDKLANVFKADALRYVLIYHIGGAYFDLDSKVIKPIDELTEKYDCVIGPEPVENSVSILNLRTLVANSGFLCMPGHIFFRRVIDLIPVHGRVQPGPVFLSKCFNIFLDEQLNNKTASKQEFEIKMAPHDYFEYTVNVGHDVDGRMKRLCGNYTVHVQKYLSLCKGADRVEYSDDKRLVITDCERMYDMLYQEIPEGKKIVFHACVEWISHGEANREPSAKRLIEHVHYGTHRKHVFEKMDFKKENNISQILPGITFHL